MKDTEWKLVDRFKEPSSWTALMGVLAGIGVVVPSGLAQGIAFAGAAACCVLGFAMKEGNHA